MTKEITICEIRCTFPVVFLVLGIYNHIWKRGNIHLKRNSFPVCVCVCVCVCLMN